MTPVVLRTPRLVLEAPGERDIDAVTGYCQDPTLQRCTTVPVPYRREDAERFLLELAPRWWEEGTEQTWAIRLADVPDALLLGVIALRSSAEVGYWMGAPHRGHGYLGEALEVVVDHWFRAGNERMTWSCLVGNIPSARTARRAGFHFTGTAPATVAHRDGAHPDSWHGELFAGEPREPQPGWPAEVQ
ncbi:MAG TPA: GNAT family N-acetyltransferase [Amnibacterium sp.]|jgi:RimJ/RimL family protein N-acetyltransferase|nr:GNAT family N-acetyltransferase [Amnibacterium sp.]